MYLVCNSLPPFLPWSIMDGEAIRPSPFISLFLRCWQGVRSSARGTTRINILSSDTAKKLLAVAGFVGVLVIVVHTVKSKKESESKTVEKKTIDPQALMGTGLRGITIGTCYTSSVHPTQGLFYCELPIKGVIDWEPERVIYLLLKGREGTTEEIKNFKSDLKKRGEVSAEVLESIQQLDPTLEPIHLLTMALLILGGKEGGGKYEEECLNLIAKIPTLVASVILHHAKHKEGVKSNAELGYIENFASMVQPLNEEEGDQENLTSIFKLFYILHMDHGGGNLSTFAAKVVASGRSSIYEAVATAILALGTPLHGKANQYGFEQIQKAIDTLGENDTEEEVEKHIRGLLKSDVLWGAGHAVLRVEDPRAAILYEFAKKNYPEEPHVKMALKFRTLGTKVLTENPRISNPHPNVDAISGSLLTAAGFPFPQYFTLLFALSRSAGVAIQVMQERAERNGKGIPLMRPRYEYAKRPDNNTQTT